MPSKAPGPINTAANKVNHGERIARTEGELSASKGGDEGAHVKDAETGAVVWCPPGGDGRVVAVYNDGLTVTRHADGTVQRSWEGKCGRDSAVGAALVLVECAGFASVEVRKSRGSLGVCGVC